MELQLTIFLGLIVLVLMGNAALLWFIRKLLKRAADQAGREDARARAFLGRVKVGLDHLEATSEHAAQWAALSRERARELEDDFARAEDWVRYGLAKVDFKVEKVSKRLSGKTRRVEDAVRGPLSQTAMLLQGAKVVLEILNRYQGNGAGGPRRRE